MLHVFNLLPIHGCHDNYITMETTFTYQSEHLLQFTLHTASSSDKFTISLHNSITFSLVWCYNAITYKSDIIKLCIDGFRDLLTSAERIVVYVQCVYSVYASSAHSLVFVYISAENLFVCT